MPTFLFWNLKGSPPVGTLERLARAHQVDVCILAECELERAKIMKELYQGRAKPFSHHPRVIGAAVEGNPDVEVYSAFGVESGVTTDEGMWGCVCYRFTEPGKSPILVFVAHLSSKLHQSDDSQALDCSELSRDIRSVEDREGHRRTLFVGDLNMNPFEIGMVAASGLNAVTDRRIAKSEAKGHKGKEYPFFYNPMWSHFGDRDGKPPGTYFRNTSQNARHYWNIFDQVLVRPDLLDRFAADSVRILDSDGVDSFLTAQGRPNGGISDHLPILFRLDD